MTERKPPGKTLTYIGISHCNISACLPCFNITCLGDQNGANVNKLLLNHTFSRGY